MPVNPSPSENERQTQEDPASHIVDANTIGHPQAPPPTSWTIVAARLLLTVAMTAAGYLAWVSLSGGSVVGCGPASPCDKVLQSRWAYWLGVPVTLPALGIYATLLATTFTISRAASTRWVRWSWWGVMTLSITVVGAALWFVALQAFVLKGFCKFCLTAHGCGFVGALLLLKQAPLRASPFSSMALSVRSIAGCGVLGVVGVMILAFGQILVEKRQYEVNTTSISESTSTSARQLSIHDGQFQLRLDELPLVGSPDAPHVVVSLFDYTCPHCRVMHGIWKEAQQRFSNQLAIVHLPVPLSSNCNAQLKTTLPTYRESCDYARLGLAVWRANRAAFAEFDAWILAPPTPPPVEAAREHAEKLVGLENLDRALQDEWVEAQIQTNVAIYAQNNLVMKSLKMPQAIVGRAIVIGAIRKTEDMDRLLVQELKIALQP